jgi:hypothetical protein
MLRFNSLVLRALKILVQEALHRRWPESWYCGPKWEVEQLIQDMDAYEAKEKPDA